MEEIDIKELIDMFLEKKWLIIISIVVFAVLGVVYSKFYVTPIYESYTRLVLAASEKKENIINNQNEFNTDENVMKAEITQADVTLNSKLVSTYSELIKTNDVIRKVINNLKIDIDENELKKNISVTSVKDTELIAISVKTKDSKQSAKIANEISKVFIDKVAEIYNINNVHIVEEAEEAKEPCNVNTVKDVLIFALVGMVLSSGIILIQNMLDTTIKTEEDIENAVGLSVIATIPDCEFINTNKRR